MGRGSGQNDMAAGIPIDATTSSALPYSKIHRQVTPKSESIEVFSNGEAKQMMYQSMGTAHLDGGYKPDRDVTVVAMGAAECAESADKLALGTDSSLGPIHFCFIVHGHKGRPTDLSYLHQTVKEKAMFMNAASSASCVVGATDQDRTNVTIIENSLDANDEAKHAKKWTHALKERKSSKQVRRKKRDRFPLHSKTQSDESEEEKNSPQVTSKHEHHQSLRKAISHAISHSAKKKSKSSEKDQCNKVEIAPSPESVELKAQDLSNITSQSDKNAIQFIVHNAVCNEGRTDDGIEKGGERLANEIIDVIRQEVKQRNRNDEHDCHSPSPNQKINVTISLVGNSLGGLYGRYAIARLSEILDSPHASDASNATDGTYFILDGNIRVYFNVFCTTASPHLGCANHTYFTIPRVAEIGVAHALGETGKDLFRLNDLLHTMATSPRFLRPLALFRKRIAYANAFGTDFPVPGSTAAFLDHDSDYPHYFEEYFEEENDRIVEEIGNEIGASANSGHPDSDPVDRRKGERACPATEKGLLIATLHTPRLDLDEFLQKKNGSKNDLAAMSSSLDSLGWKKIFIDMRKEIPIGATIPSILPTIKSKSAPNVSCPIQKLKPNRVVESRALASAVSQSSLDRITLPLGHNAICAFSRGTVSTIMNSGGRSVMDSLAIDLANEISLWNGPN